MDASPQSRMTLGQALAGQWQILLFIVSLAAFATLMLQLRPERHHPSFEEGFNQLVDLSSSRQYQKFYVQAEALRRNAQDDVQLGEVHGLAAQTRAQELRQRQVFGVDVYQQKSVVENYQTILQDYTEAIRREWVAPESSESVEVFHDMGLAHWCMNNAGQAIGYLRSAIAVEGVFVAPIYQDLVQMYLASRPPDYLIKAETLLETLLQRSNLKIEERAWAFVRKAEVLIAQGQEDQALAWLNTADPEVQQSPYRNDIEFLRGRAWRRQGQVDEADTVLRKLHNRITSRGDLYAQVALELGHINYDQYRDFDAQKFYEKVVATQVGKDWHVAGLWGLARCAAMHQRYETSFELYQEVVIALSENAFNRAISPGQVQESLTAFSRQLSLQKEYALALRFTEIEQQIAQVGDIQAAQRFALMSERRARELQFELQEAQAEIRQQDPTETEAVWVEQQNRLIVTHFENAAQAYERLATLAIETDALYRQSLQQAAVNYDRAGNVEKSIETWHRIVRERQGQPLGLQALFQLAQAYRAIGEYDKAIEFFELLRQEHPTSPVAFRAMVPLAKCYLAKADPESDKAEALLQEVLQNPGLTPKAAAYRDATIELGELYYEDRHYAEAISKFHEVIEREPRGKFIGKTYFLAADSYRNSALALDATLEQLALDPTATVSQDATQKLRLRHLEEAGAYFSEAISAYEKIPQGRRGPLDNLYLNQAWLYRADCLFDLGRYRQAIKEYDQVALRYQLTDTALTAILQIINCQVMLGDLDEARFAKRKAVWQLGKMPEEAFVAGASSRSRQQWQDWFDWLETSVLL